jgi:hypothetical protein
MISANMNTAFNTAIMIKEKDEFKQMATFQPKSGPNSKWFFTFKYFSKKMSNIFLRCGKNMVFAAR